jgi:type IX secretion system PorP/SprF family membrane protein
MKKVKLIILFLFMLPKIILAQDEYVVSQSKFLQKSNTSYFGFNQMGKVGVLYNTLEVNENERIDNKYAFASLPFQNRNFSLGFDINFFDLKNTGLRIGLSRFVYVYKVQLDSQVFFLPSVYVGLGSQNIDVSSMVFSDQLNRNSGFINSNSVDPVSENLGVINYLDIGASFLVHSDSFLLGLSLKQINKPNISFNDEDTFQKEIKIGFQAGYEFDINPFGRSYLPRYSYLYTFLNTMKEGSSIYAQMEQKFNLGEFNLGFSEQASMIDSFGMNNIGVNIGLNLENFYFNLGYNFPMRSIGKVYAPSIFELAVIFDFSIYQRNNRGLYKSLQIDNYY